MMSSGAREGSSGLTLDAGALIAFERGDRAMLALLVVARQRRRAIVAPAGVVAQVWRNGKKQARLAQLLGSDAVEVEPFTDERARGAGQLLGLTGTSDIVDAAVVLCARRRKQVVVTSDPDDIARLDPELPVVRV